jgi:predicted nucleotide-binding protein
MRIAIVGSSQSKSDVGAPIHNRAGVERFCRALGESLGRARHSILVESDDPRTADRSVAEGVLSAGKDRQASVTVFHRVPRKTERPFAKEASRYRGVFKFVHLDDRHVGPTHLRMLRDADVAIVVGGGSHAYPAGLAAAFMGVRMMPVATFGGAAGKLWQDFSDQFPKPVIKLPLRSTWEVLAGDPTEALQNIVAELAGLPRIMVVHGRSGDHAELRKILQTLGVANPIVLREQFQAGDTIPEKFEREALQADAAIALFTPDDQAAALLDGTGKPVPVDELKQRVRARQNVSLEYGWFWGRLDRDRVLLLLKGELELPSDLSGLLYAHYETTLADVEPAIRDFIGKLRSG